VRVALPVVVPECGPSCGCWACVDGPEPAPAGPLAVEIELVNGTRYGSFAEWALAVRKNLRAAYGEPTRRAPAVARAPVAPVAPLSPESSTDELVAELVRREAARKATVAERARARATDPALVAARRERQRARYHEQREAARKAAEAAPLPVVSTPPAAPAFSPGSLAASVDAERARFAPAAPEAPGPGAVVVRGSSDLVRWLAGPGRDRVALCREDLAPLALAILDDVRANAILGESPEDCPRLGGDWSGYLERVDLERLIDGLAARA
jgi:hypothetical protein